MVAFYIDLSPVVIIDIFEPDRDSRSKARGPAETMLSEEDQRDLTRKRQLEANMTKVFTIVFLLFASVTLASMPVEVTITGCVRDGKFTSIETDYGTHRVKKDYLIRVIEKDTRQPLDLTMYNNKELSIKGYILPGDLFYVDKKSIRVIGNCMKRGKLSLEEQERLAKQLFTEMSKADNYDTDLFIRLYARVIKECPDTEKAQEAYWRLTNLYLQAFDPPQYEKIVSLLEEAVKKYPNTPATPHYKQRLLRAYEETRQWQRAVTLYEEALIANPEILSEPENAATMIGYADALIGSGNKEKALSILNKVVGFGPKIEDWVLDIAEHKIKALKQKP